MNNELYHWGIKGQKWGNRRYQNEDGTYTEEGKIRRRKGSEDYLKVKEIKKKSIKSMSNKELQDANNRMNLERTYKQNTQSLGKRLVDKYMNKVAEKSMEALAVATVAAGTVFIKKVLGK